MKAEHSLAQLCAAFDVKRSGYQAWAKAGPSAQQRADAALLPKIRASFTRHKGRYGAPRIREELAGAGARHSGKRIARLMQGAGLRGLCSRRYVPRTTQSDHDQPIAPNLLAQRPAPTGPNQTWVTDLTYVPTWAGVAYVCFIVDAFSRMIVGWRVAGHMRTSMVLDALEMARWSRGTRLPDLRCHSDAGSQFTSVRYGERLVSHDLAFRVLADLRVRFFERLIPLVPEGLRGVRSGDVLSRFVGDVDLYEMAADFGRGGLPQFGIEIENRHFRAGICEAPRGSCTQSRGAAGHDRHPSLAQSSHCSLPFLACLAPPS